MLELLLATQSGGYYPHSGPGSKILRTGDPELGYFGTVTDAEMGGVSEVLYTALKAGSSEPNVYTQLVTPTWTKWFFRGKVYYYPINALCYGASFPDLCSSGLAFGDGRKVNFNLNNAGTVTKAFREQNRRLSVKENGRNWILIPRLPVIDNETVYPGTTAGAQSEVAVLLPRIWGLIKDDINRTERFRPATTAVGEGTNQLLAVKDVYNIFQGNASAKNNVDMFYRETYAYYPSSVGADPTLGREVIPSLSGVRKYYYRPLIILDEETDKIVSEVWAIGDPVLKAKLEFDGQNLADIFGVEVLEQLSVDLPEVVGNVLYSQSIDMDTSFRERAASTTELIEVGRTTEFTFSQNDDPYTVALADIATETAVVAANQGFWKTGGDALVAEVDENVVMGTKADSDILAEVRIHRLTSQENIAANLGEEVQCSRAYVDLAVQEAIPMKAVISLETGDGPFWLRETRFFNEPVIQIAHSKYVVGYAPSDLVFTNSLVEGTITIEKV